MKKETEVKWIVNLLSAKDIYVNSLKAHINIRSAKKGSTIPGLIHYANANGDTKSFRAWIEDMTELDFFSPTPMKDNNGNNILIYLLNRPKLHNYLKTFEYWKNCKIVSEDNL